MTYLISKELAQAIVNYLERQPFKDVHVLISGLIQMSEHQEEKKDGKVAELVKK